MNFSGMSQHDLSKYNKSNFSGLEHSDEHSFMNPLLQMLYVLPATHYALKTHLSGIDVSLSDELGFLYHIMDQAKHLPSKDKSVEPLNFLRYFRNIPEAGALGLLHEDKLNMERRVGACTRFLLEHINKEMKNTDQRAGKGPSSSTGNGSSGSSGK